MNSKTTPNTTPIWQLEELAMNAWPAEVIQSVEGWRLRFTQGVSRRANSAWSNQPTGSRPLAERIANVESFYAAHETDACFHISPLSAPGLDAALEKRGYYSNGATWVQSAALDRVLAATSKGASIQLTPDPTELWEQVAWPEAGLRPEVRRGILRRIGPPKVCALAFEEGRAVAAGLAVCERGQVGIFSMRTREDARGRGLACNLLHALADWGRGLGAEKACLQVEEDNPTAQRVYARASFETTYAYHYRSLAHALRE